MIPEIEPIEITIHKDSSIPKYIQIADIITTDILNGKIKRGKKIPSINELSDSTSLSRDTIEKAYKILQDQNLIYSVKGVGNFVTEDKSLTKINVLFLINKPSSYKIEVYNAFINKINKKAHVNMYLYYCDENLFINALKKNIKTYDYFVIMPHFKSRTKKHVNYTPKVIKAIETIPKEKLVIIDNSYSEISGSFSAISQNYKQDIIQGLVKAAEKLKQYNKIILVYPTQSVFPYPSGILTGFIEFCHHYHFKYEILNEIYSDLEFSSKEVYITIQENDLVKLIEQINYKKLVTGKDIGVISYNETTLKELLGITVISTDFKAMGEGTAKLILSNTIQQLKNPFHYIERSSL